MPSSVQWLIIAVISVVVVILLNLYILPYLNIDILSMMTGTSDLGNLFEESDYTQLDDYIGYELSYEGMILEKDSGVDDINNALQDYSKAWDCSGCSSCSLISGLSNTYKCSSCNACSDETETGRFKDCIVCDVGKGTCTMCNDTEEYELCNEIKSCILEYYGDPYYEGITGCFLREIPHNDGTSFDMNTLRSILSTCKDESITVNMGGDFDKELCYFNSSSISYYDFKRPYDFYMSVEATNILRNIIISMSAPRGIMRYTDEDLAAFELVNGELVNRYNVSIRINGTRNTNYELKIGYWTGSSYISIYTLGNVQTDYNGNGYAMFSEFPQQWKDDVLPQGGDFNEEKNKMNFILTDTGVALPPSMGVTFYLNGPVSSNTWSYDLRYPHCNFDTDPEPFLEESPWWIEKPDDLSSPLYTNDDPDSAIKVFYDSTMPGGGSSSNRGNVKLQLGRLDIDFMRDCKFDIYVCSQDAFAEYEGEGILDLNDFLINFDLSYVYRTVDVGSDKIIIYNTFVMDLDKDYTIEEVKSAIKTGFRTWSHSTFVSSSFFSMGWFGNENNDGIYEGEWNEMTGMVNYNGDCWSNDVTNMMSSNDRFLIGNCPGNICRGKLKVTVAFKYKPPSSFFLTEYPLYPTISFCSQS